MTEQTVGKSSHKVFFGTQAVEALGKVELLKDQRDFLLSERLHADRLIWPRLESFNSSLADEDIILAFCISEGCVVSTGECHVVKVDPVWKATVENMATLKSHDGRGYGTAILKALINESRRRWGKEIDLVLTNNPNKENAEFYLKNGWELYDTRVYKYKGD